MKLYQTKCKNKTKESGISLTPIGTVALLMYLEVIKDLGTFSLPTGDIYLYIN
jgi:hypothetical protein